MKTSRRTFGRQLGFALGALPLVSLTAGIVEGQKVKTRKRKKFDGDSPITVGGGGGKRARNVRPPFSEIYFKHDDYILQGSTYDQNPLLELWKVSVGRPNHWTNYPASANTRVEVEYIYGAVTRTIIINEDGKMGVTFSQDDFPYDMVEKKHKSGRAEISKLTIGGSEKTLPENGNFEIVAHTRLKAKSRS